jgi:riboflavin kinase/FMN adenylyltransferase
VLVDALGATHVSVGENFRFGHKASGTPELLEADPRFETRVVRLVEASEEIVSSSHIRGLVLAGEVAEAAELLGAPFQLRGPVVQGDERGRTLGYPTANLVPDERYVYPAHGIYACRAEVPGEGSWTAATSVGVRPTFTTGRGVLVEAYLLDFAGDLYDRELRLDFLARLRGERRFDSVEALVAQMARDVEAARRAATLSRP